MRELGLAEVTAFFDAHFSGGAPLRRKLASSWWSQSDVAAKADAAAKTDVEAEHHTE